MSIIYQSVTAIGLKYKLADFEAAAKLQLVRRHPECGAGSTYFLYGLGFDRALAALAYDRCPGLRRKSDVFDVEQEGNQRFAYLCDEALALSKLFGAPAVELLDSPDEVEVVATSHKDFFLTNVMADPYAVYNDALRWNPAARAATNIAKLAKTLAKAGLPLAPVQIISFRAFAG